MTGGCRAGCRRRRWLSRGFRWWRWGWKEGAEFGNSPSHGRKAFRESAAHQCNIHHQVQPSNPRSQRGPAQVCVSPEFSQQSPQHAASKPWTPHLKNDSEWTTPDPSLDCEASRAGSISICLTQSRQAIGIYLLELNAQHLILKSFDMQFITKGGVSLS